MSDIQSFQKNKYSMLCTLRSSIPKLDNVRVYTSLNVVVTCNGSVDLHEEEKLYINEVYEFSVKNLTVKE